MKTVTIQFDCRALFYEDLPKQCFPVVLACFSDDFPFRDDETMELVMLAERFKY